VGSPSWVAGLELIWRCRTEEMAPKYFQYDDVPYHQMWDESKYWIPAVLKGEREGQMVFHYVQFGDLWEGITARIEKWLAVDDNHGGKEGVIGRQALEWVEGVRGVV
jgi:hypothetical protein